MSNAATTESKIIHLHEKEPFGIGGRRLCFEHPHDRSKCIKVLRHDDRRTIRGKRSGFVPAQLRRKYDNNADERQILEDLYRRVGPAMSEHLPVSHGMADTDRGPGLVLDLVRDFSGQISRSLRELISTGHELETFRDAYDEFGEFLTRHMILTRSLLDHNLAMQEREDGSWKMYLIDGFGDPAWLPIARWVPSVGLRKIRRRLSGAWPRFQELIRQGGVTPEMIAQSSWSQGFLNHRGD